MRPIRGLASVTVAHRWRRRTRLTARRLGALALVVAMVALAGAACAGGAPQSGSSGARRTGWWRRPRPPPRSESTTARSATPTASRRARCSRRPRSRRSSAGPVGEATPIYPYCQWLVGDDAFIAVTIYRQPIGEARNFHPVRFDTTGLGDDGGYIATTRAVVLRQGRRHLFDPVAEGRRLHDGRDRTALRARASRAREGVSRARSSRSAHPTRSPSRPSRPWMALVIAVAAASRCWRRSSS